VYTELRLASFVFFYPLLSSQTSRKCSATLAGRRAPLPPRQRAGPWRPKMRALCPATWSRTAPSASSAPLRTRLLRALKIVPQKHATLAARAAGPISRQAGAAAGQTSYVAASLKLCAWLLGCMRLFVLAELLRAMMMKMVTCLTLLNSTSRSTAFLQPPWRTPPGSPSILTRVRLFFASLMSLVSFHV
jgi:hypothetical protein